MSAFPESQALETDLNLVEVLLLLGLGLLKLTELGLFRVLSNFCEGCYKFYLGMGVFGFRLKESTA